MNYTETVNAIKDYTQNDEVTFTGMIDNFIRSAEERVFTSIQIPAHFASTDATTLASGASTHAIPNAVEVYAVRISNNSETGPWSYLLRKDWDFLLEAYPDTVLNRGEPKFYAIDTSSVVESVPQTKIGFAPTTKVNTYELVVEYYSKAEADSLTDADNLNGTWLSISFPNTLLHGSLAEAYGFMKTEAGMTNYYEQKFQADIQGLTAVLSGNPVESPASAA